MFKKLEEYIFEITANYESISSMREEKLLAIAEYIREKINDSKTAKLNFICTHNSRRSHLAQVWTSTAAHYFNIQNIESYSGGTEATAFNSRAVNSLKRAGFKVKKGEGDNPEIKIAFSEEAEPLTCYSKKFDDSANPDTEFAAIMTCSEADEDCPFVPGAEFRASITYRDPKESDGTDQEMYIYDERCRQIATEMFYMLSLV